MNFFRAFLISIIALCNAHVMQANWFAYNPLDFDVTVDSKDVAGKEISQKIKSHEFSGFSEEFNYADFNKKAVAVKGNKEKAKLIKFPMHETVPVLILC